MEKVDYIAPGVFIFKLKYLLATPSPSPPVSATSSRFHREKRNLAGRNNFARDIEKFDRNVELTSALEFHRDKDTISPAEQRTGKIYPSLEANRLPWPQKTLKGCSRKREKKKKKEERMRVRVSYDHHPLN